MSRYWQIYRPDCQRLLADGARKAGATIEYCREVLKVDAEQGTVYLTDGKIIEADIVVCADGIGKSSGPFNLIANGARHTIKGEGIHRRQRECRARRTGRV